MKKNGILVGVIVVLALGVGVLGFEVINLKDEVTGFRAMPPWMSPSTMPQVRSGAFPKWQREPIYELSRLQNEVNKLFNESLWRGLGRRNPGFLGKTGIFNPEVDIKETPTQYIVKADLPGMEKDQIKIEVKDHTLILSGEKNKEIKESKGNRFFRKERSFGSFTRIITLPDDARTDSISADYKRGVLTIAIPRAAPNNENPSGNKVVVQ